MRLQVKEHFSERNFVFFHDCFHLSMISVVMAGIHGYVTLLENGNIFLVAKDMRIFWRDGGLVLGICGFNFLV